MKKQQKEIQKFVEGRTEGWAGKKEKDVRESWSAQNGKRKGSDEGKVDWES